MRRILFNAGTLILVLVTACLMCRAVLAQVASLPRPQLVPQTGHTGWIFSVAFSPDGRLLASSGDSSIKLWSVADRRQFRTLTGHTKSVGSVAFSPDGKLLASASDEVLLWNVAEGRAVRRITGHDLGVNSVAFSPDGKLLASGSNDETAALWNVATGREVLRINGHTGMVTVVAFSPDGRLLATGGTDKIAKLWNVEDGKELRTLAGHTWAVTSLAFSPDGKLLVTGSGDKTVKLWNVARGRELRTLAGGSKVAISPDGKLLAIGSDDKAIRLLNIENGLEVGRLTGHTGKIGSVAFSSDGKLLASGDWDSSVKLWNLASGQEVSTPPGRIRAVEAVAFSADGTLLASGSADDAARLWRLPDGRDVRGLTGHTADVSSVAFSPDGNLLATGSADKTVKVWSVAEGREVRTFKGAMLSARNSIAFSPDGGVLAVGSDDQGVSFWSVSTGRLVGSLAGRISSLPNTFGLSPDGRLLATSHNMTVRLWELKSMVNYSTLNGHTGAVGSITFSPNGKLLATGSWDHTVILWSLADDEEPRLLAGHTATVRSVAFSPGGLLLASGSEDSTIRLWSVANGRTLRRLTGHTATVRSVAFSPDGGLLASGGDDGTVRIWEPSSGRELLSMCARSSGFDWLVMSPEGLFDGSDSGIQSLVAWRIGNRVYPPDRFFNYYTPGLLADVFSGKRPTPAVDIAKLKLPPDIVITAPDTNVTVQNSRISLTAESTDQGGGVREVRLYHNGKLVGAQEGRGGSKASYTFQIDLVPDKNVLGVRAYSTDYVESNLAEARVVYKAPQKPGPSLHLLIVGINRYADSQFDLQFARPDAESILRLFQQRGPRLFASVNPIVLFDEKATKKNIMEALDRLTQVTQPEDVLLIYLVGHGVGVGQQFYFLGHEMKDEQDDEAAYRKYGMTATALGDALYRARALHQVLILDTCESEAALPALSKMALFKTRGNTENRALKMLARSHGVYLLAAATQVQRAHEVSQLGHGILTYALLDALGEKGHPKAEVNGIVTVEYLIPYVKQQVEELTEKYLKGKRQNPVTATAGTDFPLVVR